MALDNNILVNKIILLRKFRSRFNGHLRFMRMIEGKTPMLIRVILVASVLITLLFLWAFLHERVIFKYDGYVLATDVVGQFGDFIGGVIGTIVSICLLYYTFSLQRREMERNSLTARIQQFQSTFYRFVDHYLKMTDALAYKVGETGVSGKQVLFTKYKEMQDSFDCGSNIESVVRKRAMVAYMSLYAKDGFYMPALYRTLYSAFHEADKQISVVGEDAAITAIKFLRSQMSDAELCLLRYNYKSMPGRPFRPLINNYNLLKHLPPLELLEYTYWRNKLNTDEQSATNIILQAIKKNIYKVLEKKVNKVESYTNNSLIYNVNVSADDERSSFEICLYINPDKQPGEYDLIKGINRLTCDDRVSLLMFFLRDTVMLSFAPDYINLPVDLVWEKVIRAIEGKCIVRVENKKKEPLRLRKAQYPLGNS